MVDNENIDNTDNNETETGGRKRKGLFGTRRVVRRASLGFTDTSVEPDEQRTGAAPSDDAAEGEDIRPDAAEPQTAAQQTAEPLTATPVGLEPPALPQKHGEPELPAAAAAAGPPPTTLLFQAPDVLPLPPLPESDEEPTGGVRRRSRRRAGETGREGANDPADTVVKVR